MNKEIPSRSLGNTRKQIDIFSGWKNPHAV